MQYEIQGGTLPVAVCYLKQGEAVFTERGAMSWMNGAMRMQTTTNGGFGKALGRMMSKESFFQNIYTAERGNGVIAFSSSFPGTIAPFEVGPGRELILQKSAFMAADMSVNLSIHFSKKMGAGLFGGEGFIMQKVSGQGIVLAEFDGHVVRYDLAPGEQIIADTGYVAAMTSGCRMDIQTVPGIKNMMFGGEGLFNTVVTGPGTVWLQTMPLAAVAGCLRPFFPSSSN